MNKKLYAIIVFITLFCFTGCNKVENNETGNEIEIPKEEVSCLEKVQNDDFSCYTGEYTNYFNDSNMNFDNEYFLNLKNERGMDLKDDGSICFTNEEYPLPGRGYEICVYPIGTPLTIYVCYAEDGNQDIVTNGYKSDENTTRIYWQTSSGCNDYRATLYLKSDN